MQNKCLSRTVRVNASVIKDKRLVSLVPSSRRSVVLGFAGACAGLLASVRADARQQSETGTVSASAIAQKAATPPMMIDRLQGAKVGYYGSPSGSLVYVGRGGGGKRSGGR